MNLLYPHIFSPRKVGNVQKAVRQGFDAAMCIGW